MSVNYRYGIRNAKIAIMTATVGTYGTPFAEVGAESVEESESGGGSTTFHSDDGNPATVNGAAGNQTLNVQFAEFSTQYQTDVLGHSVDATTGGVRRSYDDEGAIFAFGYEVQGTSKGTRVWKFGCTSSEPTANHQTNGESVNEAPESCTITVGGDAVNGAELVCHEGDTGYDTFLDAVPTVAAAGNGE